jgi:hypothetical protein
MYRVVRDGKIANLVLTGTDMPKDAYDVNDPVGTECSI